MDERVLHAGEPVVAGAPAPPPTTTKEIMYWESS
jgi:hypothetical protein